MRCQQKGKMGFLSCTGCPARQGDKRRTTAAKGGQGQERGQKEEAWAPTITYDNHIWVSLVHYTWQKRLDLRHLTIPHIKWLPSRQGIPNHKGLCSVWKDVGSLSGIGLPDLANKKIGRPVFYLATLLEAEELKLEPKIPLQRNTFWEALTEQFTGSEKGLFI